MSFKGSHSEESFQDLSSTSYNSLESFNFRECMDLIEDLYSIVAESKMQIVKLQSAIETQNIVNEELRTENQKIRDDMSLYTNRIKDLESKYLDADKTNSVVLNRRLNFLERRTFAIEDTATNNEKDLKILKNRLEKIKLNSNTTKLTSISNNSTDDQLNLQYNKPDIDNLLFNTTSKYYKKPMHAPGFYDKDNDDEATCFPHTKSFSKQYLLMPQKKGEKFDMAMEWDRFIDNRKNILTEEEMKNNIKKPSFKRCDNNQSNVFTNKSANQLIDSLLIDKKTIATPKW